MTYTIQAPERTTPAIPEERKLTKYKISRNTAKT
jgi:hypothetical protein